MKNTGLVFISIPLVGHLTSMVEMAKLLTPYFTSITILTMPGGPLPAWASSAAAYLESISATDLGRIRFHELPPVEFSINDAHHGITTMALFVDAHKTHVRNSIENLMGPPSNLKIAGIVTDFVTSMIDVANDLSIPAYVYFPSSAACLSVMVYPPTLPTVKGIKNGELVEVAGISPVPLHALPDPMTDPNGYDTFIYHGRRFSQAKGIIINTFQELEPGVMAALSKGRALPPIFPVGPVLSIPKPSVKESPCISWLNTQPPSSVVFLCFGSMGSFQPDQVKQIAAGLENSNHRFLWTLRSPPKEANGPPTDTTDLDEVLPEGFFERTKDRGMVWPSWAPQMEILLHRATGGFVTHCGWNSCLESLWAGVPMLAWPLYAEQKFNACEMVRDMVVAVELRLGGGGGVVGKEEVERGVRCLMGEEEEGREVRRRVEEMKVKSRRAVECSGGGGGGGGSSSNALEVWVRDMKMGITD